MEDRTLSLTAYGARHGVSRQAAAGWRDRGFLVLQKEMVDIAASDARMRSLCKGPFKLPRGERGAAAKPARKGRNVAPQVVAGGQEVAGGAPDTPGQHLEAIARQRASATPPPPLEESLRGKEHYLHLLKELEYEQKLGMVLPKAIMLDLYGRECARLRSRIRAIPSSIAPRLARISSAPVIHATLLDYIDEVLSELSEEHPVEMPNSRPVRKES